MKSKSKLCNRDKDRKTCMHFCMQIGFILVKFYCRAFTEY